MPVNFYGISGRKSLHITQTSVERYHAIKNIVFITYKNASSFAVKQNLKRFNYYCDKECEDNKISLLDEELYKVMNYFHLIIA